MSVKSVFQFFIAAFLLYFPFIWCYLRKENPDSYGLNWRVTRKNLSETVIITSCVLLALSLVSLYWPTEDLPRRSPLGRTLNLLGAGIAAAFIEEVFFRGWMQTLFSRKIGSRASLVLTSAIFALSHLFMNPLLHSLAVFFPGLIMGFLRERHGNIASSTFFHAIANIWAIWFAPSLWLP